MTTRLKFIRWFEEFGIEDLPSVGGKNAALGEMYRELKVREINVPNGFAVTVEGYRNFLRTSHLDNVIQSALTNLEVADIIGLQQKGAEIRRAFLAAKMPDPLQEEIRIAYRHLGYPSPLPVEVAIRSSATAEDLPEASFAGQQETYLNVQGEDAVVDTCKRCFASLFTDRAISYRQELSIDPLDVALSIGIQKMVRSDLAVSGVMFSIDTESGFRDVVLINGSYGLGENIVQGAVNPDEFVVFKPTLKDGFRPIIRKRIGSKEFKLIYDIGGGKLVKNVPVAPDDRKRLCLTDEEVLTLARWACAIEEHFGRRYGKDSPMDIEWAKDGKTGELFILQARPETVKSNLATTEFVQYRIKQKGTVLLQGQSVGEKIGQGPVRVIETANDLALLKQGEILVTDKTDPDWEPAMKKAAAVVTNRGGRTCHAAIVSRELGLPAIVGTEKGTQILKTGLIVTVSCAEGEVGLVYEGKVEYEKETIHPDRISRPKTQIMMNLGDPAKAFHLRFLPNDGIGLARIEFIITSSIPIHPMALQHYPSLSDDLLKRKIDELTYGYQDKSQFFVDKLAEGVGTIAAAFYPKDVIVRLSDFKTNEYANLIGGSLYEPKEENPMLGFRGASRYYHESYRRGFALECKAMKKVREEMGLVNVKLMIPFCRTIEEGKKVLAEMEKHGLKRHEKGLEVYVMCEIPSNVILADEFSEIFDGFSIGSNDLTQLILGVDRESQIISHVFDERNPAVTKMIGQVIRTAKTKGKKIGICGQAPSDYPEFARFLVEQGIDSISLNPDAVIKTTMFIDKVEKERNLQ